MLYEKRKRKHSDPVLLAVLDGEGRRLTLTDLPWFGNSVYPIVEEPNAPHSGKLCQMALFHIPGTEHR